MYVHVQVCTVSMYMYVCTCTCCTVCMYVYIFKRLTCTSTIWPGTIFCGILIVYSSFPVNFNDSAVCPSKYCNGTIPMPIRLLR